MDKVRITCDGACSGNHQKVDPRIGGYGVILEITTEQGTFRRELQGREIGLEVTNNRMEMQALIEGLRALKRPCAVEVVLDSKYVQEGVELAKARTPKKNADLWAVLIGEINRHEVTFVWVKGHADHADNARADALATHTVTATEGVTRKRNVPGAPTSETASHARA